VVRGRRRVVRHPVRWSSASSARMGGHSVPHARPSVRRMWEGVRSALRFCGAAHASRCMPWQRRATGGAVATQTGGQRLCSRGGRAPAASGRPPPHGRAAHRVAGVPVALGVQELAGHDPAPAPAPPRRASRVRGVCGVREKPCVCESHVTSMGTGSAGRLSRCAPGQRSRASAAASFARLADLAVGLSGWLHVVADAVRQRIFQRA